MSTRDDDLIRDILARVLKVIASGDTFSEALSVQIEEEVHHDWAGETYRVSKRIDNPKSARYGPHLKKAIVAEAEKGTPVPEVQRKFGVGRATIYRLLKRG
jgi:hypothetical protein